MPFSLLFVWGILVYANKALEKCLILSYTS